MTQMPWYFILDLVLWAIAAGSIFWAWRRLGIRVRWVPVLTAVLVMVLQTFNEVLSFNYFKAWSFSLEHNRFLGISLWGAPVEEYLFWFAFAWMLPFFYSGLASTAVRPGLGGKS